MQNILVDVPNRTKKSSIIQPTFTEKLRSTVDNGWYDALLINRRQLSHLDCSTPTQSAWAKVVPFALAVCLHKVQG